MKQFWKSFFPAPQPGGGSKREVYTALDIGTEYAKALVFEARDEQGVVLGVGRQKQGYNHMQDGVVTDIKAVIANCDVALHQAEKMAGVVAPQVIIGIAGELVKGSAQTVNHQRQSPQSKITEAELEAIITNLQKEALKEARQQLSWETGYSTIDVRLINAAVVEVKIDGYKVANPIGFQGKNLSMTIFNAFTPLVQLGALESVVAGLELNLLAVVAEPYAVARCLGDSDLVKTGAIFIDIGGGTTDIALVRNGGIEGTRMFALGGRAFTKRIAGGLNLTMGKAETLKVEYASGKLDQQASDEIRQLIHSDSQTWMELVELLLIELAKEETLPPAIYLCGGGSGLPEITEQLQRYDWGKLPMPRHPDIAKIEPKNVVGITDKTGLLLDQQDITPMGLAYQALEIRTDTSVLDQALYKVIRMLKI